jgi:hypothetical protein
MHALAAAFIITSSAEQHVNVVPTTRGGIVVMTFENTEQV